MDLTLRKAAIGIFVGFLAILAEKVARRCFVWVTSA